MVGMRHLSFDNDASLPLVGTSYLAHPPSIDGTGVGLARTLTDVLKGIGLSDSNIRQQLKGCNYDGALLNTHVNDLLSTAQMSIALGQSKCWCIRTVATAPEKVVK